jgi:hypothetical protein
MDHAYSWSASQERKQLLPMFRSRHTFSKALIGAAFALMSIGGLATAAATAAQAQSVPAGHHASGSPNGHQSQPACETCVIAII